MKTLLKWVAIAILAIAVVLMVVWSFVPGMLSRDLSEKAGVPVSISSVGVTPWSLTVSDFVMGNPRGSTLSKALAVGTTKVHAPFYRYFKDKIIIDTVNMNNIYLGLEFDKPFSAQGNWTQIMRNFDRNTKGNGKPVLIKKLVITNMDIWMAFRDNPSQQPKRLKGINKMVLKNVSSEQGLPLGAITNQVVGAMLFEVFKREGIQNMIEGIFSPGGGSSGIFGGFNNLFGITETPPDDSLKPVVP